MYTTTTFLKIKFLSGRSMAGKKAPLILRPEQEEMMFQVYTGGNYQDLLGHRGQCQAEGV